MKLFGEVISKLENGYSYKENAELNYINGLPITRIETISDGFINPNKVGYVTKTSQIRCKTLLQDDILFSHINSLKHIGKIAIYDNNPPILIHGMNLLRVVSNHKIFSKYLFYFLKFNPTRNRIRSISQSAINQVSINTTDLKSLLKIILPTLKEQQKIASILSNVDALIECTADVIGKSEKLKKGLMQELLTRGIGHDKFKKIPWLFGKEIEIPEEWEIKKIDELFTFLRTGINSRKELGNGSYQYIHYGDIHTKWNLILDCDLDIIPFIDKSQVSHLPLLVEGDLIIADASEDHEGSGVSILVKNVRNQKIVSGLHTIALRDEDKHTSIDFRAYLTSINFVKIQIIAYVTGISVYGLSKKNLSNIVIPIPSLLEQQKIASILSGVDAYIQKNQECKKKLEILKKGLMQKLLTGRIRVKV